MGEGVMKTALQRDADAEYAVLGSALYDPSCLTDVQTVLPRGAGSAFTEPGLSDVYDALCEMHANSQPIDIVTLGSELASRESLEKIGGQDRLIDIWNSVPSSANAIYYSRIVLEKWMLRRIATSAHRAMTASLDVTAEPGGILKALEKDMNAIRVNMATGHSAEKIGDLAAGVIEQAIAREEEFVVPTGFAGLDSNIMGFRPGDMVTLAARPSVGKTAFALQLASHVSVNVGPVAFFSLEMRGKSIARRLVAMKSGVNAQKLFRPERLTDLDVAALSNVQVHENIIIDDTTPISGADLLTRGRLFKRQFGIAMVVIDYLGLMVDGEAKKHGRYEMVSDLSRDVKTVARDLDIPVLCLHQLNRTTDREGRAPRLSDLRDSGAIEQDSDMVMFLHRPMSVDKQKSRPEKYPVWLLVKKYRDGPLVNAKFEFRSSTTQFMELMGGDEEHGEME